MKLSRKKAIELCIELWTWLAKTGKEKGDWPKWKKYGIIHNDCWFCEYGRYRKRKNKSSDKSICVHCPLRQQDIKGCYAFAYGNWEEAQTSRTRKKYAKLFLEQIKTIVRILTLVKCYMIKQDNYDQSLDLLKQQPIASEFTKKWRHIITGGDPNISGRLTQLSGDKMLEACKRLDRAETEKKDLLKVCEKMLSEIEDSNYARYGIDPGADDESDGAKLGRELLQRIAITKAKQ